MIPSGGGCPYRRRRVAAASPVTHASRADGAQAVITHAKPEVRGAGGAPSGQQQTTVFPSGADVPIPEA
jgi:hypothetical protein